jgi:hypothetical protein
MGSCSHKRLLTATEVRACQGIWEASRCSHTATRIKPKARDVSLNVAFASWGDRVSRAPPLASTNCQADFPQLQDWPDHILQELCGMVVPASAALCVIVGSLVAGWLPPPRSDCLVQGPQARAQPLLAVTLLEMCSLPAVQSSSSWSTLASTPPSFTSSLVFAHVMP